MWFACVCMHTRRTARTLNTYVDNRFLGLFMQMVGYSLCSMQGQNRVGNVSKCRSCAQGNAHSHLPPMTGSLTVSKRCQVEEILFLPKHYQVHCPHPGDAVDGTLPNTLRKFLTIFCFQLEIDWNSLCVCAHVVSCAQVLNLNLYH